MKQHIQGGAGEDYWLERLLQLARDACREDRRRRVHFTQCMEQAMKPKFAMVRTRRVKE